MLTVGIVGDSQGEGLSSFLIPLLASKGIEVAAAFVQSGMSLRSMRAMPERVAAARAVAQQAPDALIVVLGGNDRTSTENAYAEEIRWFLEQVASRPREIWWVGPAASLEREVADAHLRARAMQRTIFARGGRVRWIDGWAMTARGVQFAGDGVHFTRAGYRTWAERLASKLPPQTPIGLLLGAAFAGVAIGVALAFARSR